MNLKQILDRVLERCLERVQPTYAANPNDNYRRLVQFANAAAADIVAQHEWSALKKRGTIAVTSGQELYDLPDDFSYLIDDTTYQHSGYRRIDMPATDAFTAWSESNTNLTYSGRFIGGQIEFKNVPSGDVHFYYQSKYPLHVANNPATGLEYFESDSDEWLLDDELLIRAVIWRHKKSQGLPEYQADMQDYGQRLKQLIYQDTGARVIGGSREPQLSPPIGKGTY